MADHSSSGAWYLLAGQITAWGQGIAHLARILARWLPGPRAGPAADATRSIASIQARGLVGYGVISRSQPDPFGKIKIIVPNGRGW